MKPNLNSRQLRFRLNRYLDATEDRDQLVKDLHAVGYSKHQIARMTRLARTTVYRILGAAYLYDHGVDRWTEPRERDVSHET